MGEIASFDQQCLEALKSIGKALGQMALYKVGHPAVAMTLKTAEDMLAAALTQSGRGELSFSLDQDKIIANGRMIGNARQLPTAIPAIFTKLKLSSLSFRAGLKSEELAAFCELAASRSDAAALSNPKGYLAQRGVEHIALNEAVYTKMDAAAAKKFEEGFSEELGAGAGQGPRPASGAQASGSMPGEGEILNGVLGEAIGSRSMEGTIEALVAKSVPDPVLRAKVLEQVMKLVQEDIERRINEVVNPLRQEKNRVQNDQVRTQTVVQNLVEGVIVVDEQGKILMMNPAAEHIYGTPLTQMAGLPLVEKSGSNQVVTLATELTTPSDRPISEGVRVQAEQDMRRTIASSGAVVQNEAGKIVGMVSSPTDAAKYRELERTQREFVAHVTHELRAPLSSIRAALEILQGEASAKLEQEQNHMLDTAVKNSDRLSDLINSILDFSKIEAGEMTVFPKKSDPAVIAKEAADSLTPWASKKKIKLSVEAAAGLPMVAADSQRTVQVIINLLSNAIKFTPADGSIRVIVKPSPENARFVEFSVSDTGPGIPKSEQERIFEKFVQIASGQTFMGGTGLGLSIAKALVHLQNGRMWVKSEAGRGATFFFTLPVFVDSAGPSDHHLPAPRRKSWWKRMLGSRK